MRFNSKARYFSFHKNQGFTLVEVIVGIVMLAISLAIISTLIAPTEQQSADNILQIKAAELGQSVLDDITSRAFDHNSDMSGGRVRCGEPSLAINPCTTSLGPETGESRREHFNDVDDFHGYSWETDAEGNDLHSSYGSFEVSVAVAYAGSELGLGTANNGLAKRITVTVITPLNTPIAFSTYKTNF